MANPEDNQKAWQIIQKTVGQDNPQINLANSIAANLEKAREEGYRSAFQQPVYTETKRSNDGLFQFAIIVALIAGFVGVVLVAGSGR